MNYKDKYLKYKNKYLKYKNKLKGGVISGVIADDLYHYFQKVVR